MELWLTDDEAALIRGRARVGEAEITVCTDGTCLFDGGAMFGVVPRTLWEKKALPDATNRVKLGLNCVVVRLHGRTLLIETGFGNKVSPKLQKIMATEGLLPASLAATGVSPDQIDLVVNTHLHWDHCGWNTHLDASGEAQPFFPNATYVMHAGEVEHGRRQMERDRISYVPANYEPLLGDGRVRLIHNKEPGVREEIMPGVTVECFPGHTRQLMVVHVESKGERACFVSDLMPTAAHVQPTWVMAFDLDPLRTIEEKRRFYDFAIAQNVLVFLPHDHFQCAGKLAQSGDGNFRFESRNL